MSKLPPLAMVAAAVGAYFLWKKGQTGPVSGLGHGGGHGGGHHGGGGGWGGRGIWGGGWGDSYTDYVFTGPAPHLADCYRDAQGNLILGVPSNPAFKRSKCMVDANGSILNAVSSPVSGLGWGFHAPSIKSVTSAVTSAVKSPQAILMTAATGGAGTPLLSTVQALRAGGASSSIVRPLTVPMTALKAPLMGAKGTVTNLVQGGSWASATKAGTRVAMGRSPSGQPTPIVSSSSQGATASGTWSPVVGRSGWEMSPGDGGSTVFRNTGMSASFYCTSSDMGSIGTPQNAVDLFMGVPLQSGPSSAAPDTASVPGQQGSTFVPSSSTSSYSTQGSSGSGQSFVDPSSLYPTASDPAAPAAATATVDQQYQPVDATAPAPGKVNPLVVAGTLIAVPLAFMLTGKK